MMNDHRLIHMNARLYDMETARFLSADTVIPEPDLYGAYNRYIYVLNNPLKYHDPSGHFWNFIIGAAVSYLASKSSNPTLRLIGSVAGMYLMGPASVEAFGSQFTSSFAAGFVNSGIQTGSLQGAFIGGTSALVTAGIGHGNAGNSITSGLTGSQAGDAMLKALLHGIAQGTMASLRGGDFKAGLSSGFVGSAMGHYTGGLSSLSEHESAQFAITVTMGGLTSRATGESFNDGVISSATVFLFNEMGDRNRNNKNQGARKLKEIKLLESAADGHLTLEEAKAWYKHMNGEPLQVFVDELNIGYIEGVQLNNKLGDASYAI